MTIRRPWRPRCCLVCGDALEEYRHPLEPEAYVGCYRCAVLYVVTEDGLERVLLSLEAPELRRVFDELVEAWWAMQQRRQDNAAARAAA